jgi:hypothetical protein
VSKRQPLRVTLPSHIVDALENYVSTSWGDGRDPSKIGALNAVCWIGEQLVAVYAVAKSKHVDWRRVKCPTCGAERDFNCKAMGGVILPDTARRRVMKPHRLRVENAKRATGANP